MSRTLVPVAALGALACFAPAGAAPAPAPAVSGGQTNYFMGASTSTGMDPTAGRPSPAAMMSMMAGGGLGGGGATRSLKLKLGSTRTANPADASHTPPPGLKMAVLPLLPPLRSDPGKETGGLLGETQGKVKIYWGCGEKAGPGQPLVIDLAAPAANARLLGEGLKPAWQPSVTTHARYVDWPNRTTRSQKVGGSLPGEHAVAGQNLPDIRFTLSQTQDFLPPLNITGKAATAAGALRLTWAPVSGARAYYATLVGSSEGENNVIMWTSSAAGPIVAMAPDYMAQDEITRQIGRKALLPASANECQIPREVAKAVPAGMLNIVAYGGEANFAQPRPAGAKPTWKPDWTAKVLYRSSAGSMLGMDDADEGEEGKPGGKKGGLGRELLKGLMPFGG